MRSQLLFYSFDTKTKPGKIIASGIRFETQEFELDESGIFDQTKFQLLARANLPEELKDKTDAIKHCIKTNL